MTDVAGLEELRQRREGYVKSARENDFEEGLKGLLSDLYPDNAHFIYELLQNAEDAGATTVEFTLTSDRLTVKHDGSRAFTLKDIDSITGIGNSTKRDDPTKIGKFGVGFKAVFAYTARPEVRSGGYAFAIEDLFIPKGLADGPPASHTVFDFPFDRTDKPAAAAVAEVERGLLELDEKTLLFLGSIDTITYELPDGRLGIVERRALDGSVIAIKKAEGDDFTESRWLRLVGPASVEGSLDHPLTVAAAFRLESPEPAKTKRAASSAGRDQIFPVRGGDVSIYFPASKEVSGLRFHIHAPFASTVARDSVRSAPENDRLVDDIAALIVHALPRLCAEGMITDSFLETLPNSADDLKDPYRRIRDAIHDAFSTLPITPVWGVGGEYAAARELVDSPDEFHRSLDSKDLPVLLALSDEVPLAPSDKPSASVRWIRKRDGRAGKFLADLDTVRFGWSELDEVLSVCGGFSADPERTRRWLAWLESKTDASLEQFYRLLSRGIDQRAISSWLGNAPIVRHRQRGGVTHVRGHETHLPARRGDKFPARVPVELAYFDDEDDPRSRDLRIFYSAAGVERWDETTGPLRRLDCYRPANRRVPKAESMDRHLNDVRAFVGLGSQVEGSIASMFGGVPFLLATQSDGSLRWVTPKETFIDEPFSATGLSALHPRKPMFRYGTKSFMQDAKPYPLSGIYLDVDGVEQFVVAAGAQTRVSIVPVDVRGNREFDERWDYGYRHSKLGSRSDWGVENLVSVIGSGNMTLLHSLWEAVCGARPDQGFARYQTNGSSPSHSFASQLAQTLKTEPWIPDRGDELRLPREMSTDDLRQGWKAPPEGSLVFSLGFGADQAERRQRQTGLTEYLRGEGLEDLFVLARALKESGVPLEEIRDLAMEVGSKRMFPENASEDPERRASVAAVDAANAPEYKREVRQRTVAVKQAQASEEARAYLREQYTNADAMFCQVCQEPMPFKTSDGAWYFQAVAFVPGRERVYRANTIALCPLCAALYKHARSTKDDVLVTSVTSRSISPGQGTVEVPVTLNEEQRVVRFSGKHAIDLKAALDVAGDARAKHARRDMSERRR